MQVLGLRSKHPTLESKSGYTELHNGTGTSGLQHSRLPKWLLVLPPYQKFVQPLLIIGHIVIIIISVLLY
jgi:hypothetical protein